MAKRAFESIERERGPQHAAAAVATAARRQLRKVICGMERLAPDRRLITRVPLPPYYTYTLRLATADTASITARRWSVA